MKIYHIGRGELHNLLQDKLRIVATFDEEVQKIISGSKKEAERQTVSDESRRQLCEQFDNRKLANAATIFDQEMGYIREGVVRFTNFLAESSPVELRPMIEKTRTIYELVTLGASFFKTSRLPDSDYGLGSIRDTFASIDKLKKSWKHIVTIVLPHNYARVRLGESFEVRFTAYDP